MQAGHIARGGGEDGGFEGNLLRKENRRRRRFAAAIGDRARCGAALLSRSQECELKFLGLMAFASVDSTRARKISAAVVPGSGGGDQIEELPRLF